MTFKEHLLKECRGRDRNNDKGIKYQILSHEPSPHYVGGYSYSFHSPVKDILSATSLAASQDLSYQPIPTIADLNILKRA